MGSPTGSCGWPAEVRALGPLAHDRLAPLARRHPLARLGAAILVMVALFLSQSVAGSAVALVAIVAAAAASGLDGRALVPRIAPVVLAAIGLGAFNGLVAGDPAAGLSVTLRVSGIALAGIVALATIEPTALADSLIQHLHAPPRFAVGALAALRLLPLFAREWEIRGRARRARGLDADRGAVARLASFPGRTHGLLVAAVRRAVLLATAMDARGFGSRPCRTLARPRSFRPPDLGLLLGALALSAGIIVAQTF